MIQRQCIWFRRILKGLEENTKDDKARNYIDVDHENNIDKEAQALKTEVSVMIM